MANTKMGLGVPIMGAVYTYEYRDTGGAWSSPKVMEGGANDPYKGFTSPECDELRITATTTASTEINRIHLAGLSISSGLVFDSSSGLSSETQPAIDRPSPTNHFTFRVSSTTATAHTLTITGIGQNKLDIRQIVFANIEWSPDYNYTFGTGISSKSKFTSQNSFNSFYQRHTFGGRSQPLRLQHESESSLLDLDHLITNQTVNGFCLFERDTLSATLRQDYAFMVYSSMSPIVNDNSLRYSTTLNIQEAFSQ